MSKDEPITVVDVFRELGFEPLPEDTWAVGSAMQKRYAEIVGKQPDKELRTKTGGGGSHCFAIYPSSWRPEIERLVKLFASQRARQGELF